VRRAFSLLYQGLARAVDANYETFDFQSWAELSVGVHDDTVGLVGRAIRVPRVILLVAYDRFPKREVRFSRMNIYSRDKQQCQYCGGRMSKSELNLDHVIPKSRGGKTSWENVVCSCFNCNRIKGGRTPAESGLRLLIAPRKPAWTPFFHGSFIKKGYREWLPFLNVADMSYWFLELEED
jgi:5-methylcytosine-specific restriction endonuclease McrA